LNIPVYVICDADTDKDEIADEDKRKSEVASHKKDNKAILSLLGHGKLSEWPSDSIWEHNMTMWKTSLTKATKDEFNGKWNNFLSQSYEYYGNPGGLIKNPLAIARALNIAWDQNCKSEKLTKLIDNIIAFAKK